MKAFQKYILVLLLFAGGLTSCEKDKLKKPVIVISKWEKITGDYKVYDTIGVFLYDMSISHSDSILPNGSHVDSLFFYNLGGCNFSTSQGAGFPDNWVETFILFSAPMPAIDTSGNRWQLYAYGDNEFYYNTWRNDTIRLRYNLNNIQYYLSDMVPYFAGTLHQIAVKQH